MGYSKKEKQLLRQGLVLLRRELLQRISNDTGNRVDGAAEDLLSINKIIAKLLCVNKNSSKKPTIITAPAKHK